MTQDSKQNYSTHLARLTPAQRQYLLRKLTLQPADTATTGNPQNAQLAACVKVKPHANLDPEELREYARTRLPDYMVPRQFFQVEALPRTAAGKIDRSAVAEYCRDMTKSRPAESNAINQTGFAAARNETEATLAAIWANVLGVDEVAIDDDFYEIGGDSLLSIRIMARANKAGMHVSPEDFFAHPTIAGQAALLTRADAESESATTSIEAPLSPIQHWFFDRVKPHTQHCSQYLCLRVAPHLDFASLQLAVQQLLLQHAVLRTAFVDNENLRTQLVATQGDVMPLQKVVISASSEPEIHTALDAEAERITRNFDLARGDLIQLRFVEDPGGGDNWLLLVIHRLLVDPESWQILLSDLYSLWSGAVSGKGAALPASAASYLDWCRRIESLAQADTLPDEPEHGQQSPAPGDAALPTVTAAANGTIAGTSIDRLSVSLTTNTTEQLQRCVDNYHAEIQDALLASIVYANARQHPNTALLTDVHTSARTTRLDDLDTTSMVGWISAFYPLVLTTTHEVQPDQLLLRVKEARRKVPLQGLEYGLLKYSSNASTESTFSSGAQVCFCHLGDTVTIAQFGSNIKPCSTGVREIQHPDSQPVYPLEINTRSTNGQLQLECVYNRNLHTRAAIESLAHACVEYLQLLVHEASDQTSEVFTPSDFPLADLDQDDLDNIAGQISDLDDDL